MGALVQVQEKTTTSFNDAVLADSVIFNRCDLVEIIFNQLL